MSVLTSCMSRRETQFLRSEFLWLLAIVASGLLVRIITVIFLDFPPKGDYAAYQSMALNLLSGKGIVDLMGNLAYYNVGYPLFVLAPIFALSHNSLLCVQLANAFLGGVSIALTYAVAREVGAGHLGRILAAGLFAFYLPSWIYAEYLAKENLMAPFMLGVMWGALRVLHTGSFRGVLVCGGLFGLLALTGNAALTLVLPALVALVIAPLSTGRKLIAATLAFITALIVTVPWMIRNYQVLGTPVLNTNGGFNLYLGNNPAATGYFISISETPRGPSWEALRKEGEVQAAETLRTEAVTWIKEHPLVFAALAIKKALVFWTPPWHEGEGTGSTMETLIRKLWLVQFILLTVAAVGSVFIPGLRIRDLGIVWLGILSYTAGHMLFYVIFRYREPLMPFLCVLAALTLERVWNDWRHRQQPNREGKTENGRGERITGKG